MSDNISPLPFMDVIVDYAFKRLFGSVQNKKILIALLNSFLSEYVGEITDLDVISLNFLDYHAPEIMGKDCFVQRVTLKNDRNEILFEKIMFFFVDLSKFADVQDACVAAMEDGFAAGEAKGEARGKTLGRMAGIAEAIRTMAIEMLKKGIPLALVSEITGLSEAELQS